MWTDSHCHLDAAEFDSDRPAVIERARTAGVAQLVLPAVARDNFDTVRELAHAHSNCNSHDLIDLVDLFYALGVHPLYTGQASMDDLLHLRSQLQQHRNDPRLVAVGEIGLDHFAPGLDRTQQEDFYVKQLKLAREFDLPVILHVRKSADTLLKHLRTNLVRGGIAHAFNGSEQQAMEFIKLGFKLGFGGAMTFERALQIRRLAQLLPLNALVLETDAPDIAPHWLYKTQIERQAGMISRNEPCELPRIGAVLAQLRGMPLDELAQATTFNVKQVLQLPTQKSAMHQAGE
jgi:TatD DNase family protein